MCLEIKKNGRLKVATKDITVYKRVNIDNIDKQSYGVTKNGNVVIGGTYIMRSGTRRFRYRFGVDYTTQLQVEIDSQGNRIVERGFHSFANLYSANKSSHYGPYLIKCVVPKGSLYYEGTNNGEGKGIASDAIRLVSFNK